MSLHDAKVLAENDAWGDLDFTSIPDLEQAERQRVLEMCRHYQAAFEGSEQGKFVLADLVRTFLVEPRIVEPGDDKFAAGIRQGNADVVRRILHFIHVARTGGQGG